MSNSKRHKEKRVRRAKSPNKLGNLHKNAKQKWEASFERVNGYKP